MKDNEINKLTEKEQSIVKYLKLLPDSSFKETWNTEEQIEHWNIWDIYYTNIGILLIHYFRGTYLKELDSIHPKDNEYWSNIQDMYIYLYDLIRKDWINVKNKFTKCGHVFDEPHQLFTQILTEESEFEFSRCTNDTDIEFTRFSPKKLYQQYQQYRKKNYFNTKDKDIINKIISRRPIYLSCLNIIEKSSLTNKNILQALKRYKCLKDEVDLFRYSSCHPRKNRNGYQWVNGNKEPINTKKI